MKRKVNLTFFAGLLAVGVVSGTGIHFLHGYQVGRNAGSLRELGREAERQQRWSEAAVLLGHYLAYRPGDTDAQASLGLVLARKAKRPRERNAALQALERVLERDAGRHDVRRRLVELAMDPSVQRYRDAQDHLHTLLEACPGDGRLERLLGECLETEGKYAEAAKCYADAVTHAPAEVDGYVRRAGLLRRRLKQPKEADACMAQLIKSTPTAAAYLARARYRQAFGPADQAAADLAQAARLAPDDAEVLLTLAEAAREGKDAAGTRRHLEHGLGRHADDARFYQALAGLEVAEGRRAEAIACLRRGLKAIPDQRELLSALATVLLDDGQEAEAAITGLHRLGVAPAYLDFLRARARLNQKDWLAALRLLNRARPDLAGVAALAKQIDYYLGRCYGGLGDVEQQYNAFHRAAAADPNWVPASLGLGAAQAALGKVDEALETYGRVLPRVPEAQVVMARLLLVKNLTAAPARRDWPAVEAALAAAARVAPAAAELTVLRAELLAAKGETNAAAALLTLARDKEPQLTDFWVALILLAEREGQTEQVRALLRDAERRLGDRAELRVAAVAHWAKRDGAEAKQALERLEQGGDRFPAAEQGRLLRALGNAYARRNEWAACARVWDRLAQLQPTDVGVRLARFDLAIQAGDEETMRRQVADTQTLEGPDGAVWRYVKAAYLLWLARQGQAAPLDEARALLTEASARRPAWSRVYLCEGQIDELRKNAAAAFRNYQHALELGERNPELIRRVVQFLYDQHRYAEAEAVLRKLPEQAALSPELQRLVAQVSLQVHDYGRALKLAEEAVAGGSKDYRDRLWLARVRWAAGKTDAAEKAMREAVALAGDVPAPRVALVLFLANVGKKDQAERALREASAKLTGAGGLLALAQCTEALGRPAEAEKQYLAALGQSRDVPTLRAVASFYVQRGDPKQAEAYLQEIIGLQSQSPEEAKWATRMLALVLTSRGDHQQAQRALELLGLLDEKDQPKAAAAASATDLRAQALVLARQKGRRPHLRAIELLQRMAERQEAMPEDQFLLARLYDLVNERAKALQVLRALVSTDATPVPILGYYALHLVRDGEAAEAEKALARLEKVPGWASTLAVTEVRARLHQLRGRPEQATAALRQYVADAKAVPDKRGTRALLAANLLAEWCQAAPAGNDYVAAAEALYREAAAERPDAALVLAEFLGRLGRVADALDACERAWPAVPPERVAPVAVALLDGGKVGPGQYRRVEDRLQKALAGSPKSGLLLACLANLHYLEGHYPEAVADYRRAVALDARNVSVLNNLAWLLALAQDQPREGLDLISQALKLAGPDPGLRDTQAIIFLKMGAGRQAVQELQEVVAEKPSGIGWFHLAQAYTAAGDRLNARTALRRAQGLKFTAAQVPPLERPLCRQMLDALK